MKRILVSSFGALAASLLALCLAGCPDEPKTADADAAPAAPTSVPTPTPVPTPVPMPTPVPTPTPNPSAVSDAGTAAAVMDASKPAPKR